METKRQSITLDSAHPGFDKLRFAAIPVKTADRFELQHIKVEEDDTDGELTVWGTDGKRVHWSDITEEQPLQPGYYQIECSTAKILVLTETISPDFNFPNAALIIPNKPQHSATIEAVDRDTIGKICIETKANFQVGLLADALGMGSIIGKNHSTSVEVRWDSTTTLAHFKTPYGQALLKPVTGGD